MNSKQKKPKKILGIPSDFDLGEKIKDISIDTSKYKTFNLILLIVLNIILASTLIYLLVVLYNICVLVISIFTMGICLVWSILSYKNNVVKVKYSIYKNAIVKDFDTSVNVGELSKLVGFKIKKSIIDKLGKNKTQTIVLKFTNAWCSRISLPCINEDSEPIVDMIIDLSQEERADLKTKSAKKHDTFLKKVLNDSPIQSKITEEIQEAKIEKENEAKIEEKNQEILNNDTETTKENINDKN